VFSKDVSFGGIALGTVAVLVAYHLMAWLEAMVAAPQGSQLLGSAKSADDAARDAGVVSPE